MTATSGQPGSEISDPKAAGSDSRSLSASVRRGALWILASNLLLRLANVLLIAVIAHILSPHDFGIFAVPTAQLVRDFKQDKIFLSNAIAFVPSTVVLILLAESGSGAMGLAWSMVVRQFVVGCVLIVAAPRHYRPGLARSALSVVLKF